MRTLVTGGAGFIGSHLIDALVERDYKVIILDNLSSGKKENLNKKAKFYKIDILSPQIFQIFKREKPEIVFHFAAQINVKKSIKNPIEDAKTNILGSLNILENCKKFKVKKIIFASSVGVYGEPKFLPIKENDLLNPISPYSIAKMTIEKYLQFYQSKNLDFVSLRFSNVYGPRQKSDGEGGVVAIFIKKLLKNKRPTIFGSGRQTRDFIFVKDAVSAVLKALNYKGKEKIFNIATGKETSINQLFKLISKILKIKIKPRYLPKREGDIQRSCLKIDLAKKFLKWKPKYDLEEGIRNTIWENKLIKSNF